MSLNVTAVETQTNDYGGFLSVYPCASVSSTKPDVSNMNFGSGQTVANAVTVSVSADGHICLYVYGTAHVLVDVNGFYMSATAGAVDAYTKEETDTKLGTKADQTTVDNDAAALRALADAMQTPLIIDSDGNLGWYASIAIGDNGNPVISYFDFTNEALKVAACANAGCMGTPKITTVDSDGNVGRYTSIAIGDNGYPVISYIDWINTTLKVAACTTTDCSGTPTVTTVDSDGNVGYYTSIAIGSNGYPVISYYDSTNEALRVAACTTADCTGTPTITTVDSTGDVGYDPSIAIGNNGYPVISYNDATNGDLKVAACTAADCTGTPTITTIDSTGNVGYYTSIAMGDNGYPVISYFDFTNEALKVAACTTADCTGTPTITTVDSDGDIGRGSSIAIGDNGYPLISYYDATNRALKVSACTTADCTGTPTITTVDSEGWVGLHPSIAIGDNGYPVISYYDSTNTALKVVPMWSFVISN